MVTNHLTNPVLIRVLEGRFGARFGRSLAVLRYTGRTTGRPRRLVAHYERDGDTVTITVAAPRQKQWWRNFTTRRPIELTLAGAPFVGTALATSGPLRVMTVTVTLDRQVGD